MNQQEMTIRDEAERLFREKFTAVGWSADDFASFNGFCIEQAVIRIAAGGEAAAMQEILGAHAGAGAMPRMDADGTVTASPLLVRCMEVIREARAAAETDEQRWDRLLTARSQLDAQIAAEREAGGSRWASFAARWTKAPAGGIVRAAGAGDDVPAHIAPAASQVKQA